MTNGEGAGARDRLGWNDAAFAALVGIVGFLYFGTQLQTRLTGDGSMLVNYLLLDGGREYPHVLYLPAARAFEDSTGLLMLHFANVLVLAKFFSAVCAAVGLAACYGVARAMGAPRSGALLAAATAALTPALTFFGTTVEVHALSFAVGSSGALAVLLAPWRRRGPALLIAAATLSLLYLTHQPGALLGLAWVGLVGAGAVRAGRPFTVRGLFLGVAPLLLGTTLFTAALTTRHHNVIGVDLGGTQALLEGWLAALGVAVPLWLVALVRRPRLAWTRFVSLAAVLPPLLFMLWWGLSERGGYFMAGLSLTLGVTAAALPRWSGWRTSPAHALWLLALVPQAWLGHRALLEFDRGYDPRARAELLREEVGETFLVVTAHAAAPDVRLFLRDAHELDLMPAGASAIAAGLSPAEFAAGLLPALDHALSDMPIVLDRSYRGDFERPAEDLLMPYLDAVEAALLEHYDVREVEHPSWPMWVVEAPRGE